MVLEPRTSTVTVIVQPGQLLGLTLCQVSNNVNEIVPGLIEDLNNTIPGSIQVGDRIAEVNGEEGPAFLLIRAFVGQLEGRPGTLRFTVVRPIEFEVAIDISTGRELGLEIMDVGFVERVSSTGVVACYNTTQGQGKPTLREGDRIIQVSGRTPSTEDGAVPNVMPYLRLAVCGGANPLRLTVRRGEYVPTREAHRPCEVVAQVAKPAQPQAPILPKAPLLGYSCLKNAITPAAVRSMQALRKLTHSSRHPLTKKERAGSMDSKVGDEPTTPSTRGPSSANSHSSERSDLEFEDYAEPWLTLPGIVRRVA
jgi:hypothetical protein